MYNTLINKHCDYIYKKKVVKRHTREGLISHPSKAPNNDSVNIATNGHKDCVRTGRRFFRGIVKCGYLIYTLL